MLMQAKLEGSGNRAMLAASPTLFSIFHKDTVINSL
jgi:hypothetical protein